MSINDNILILYFHFDFDTKYEQYRKHYAQTHDIVLVVFNSKRRINYAINIFLNICVNRFVFVEFVMIMIIIAFLRHFSSQQENKNVVIIQIKYCTHCKRYYHANNECQNKHSHLKRNRNQSTRKNQADRKN